MEGMKNWSGTAVAGLNSSAMRTVRGAISFTSSTHLPPCAGVCEAGDVAARTCEARGETAGDRIAYVHEHDGNRPRLARKGPGHERGWTEDHVGPQIGQLFC